MRKQKVNPKKRGFSSKNVRDFGLNSRKFIWDAHLVDISGKKSFFINTTQKKETLYGIIFNKSKPTA